jgi:hypothetical protein
VKKALALALIVLGILALVYRGFSYTSERHEAKLGPLSVRVDEKERVRIPVWAGVVAVGAGVALLLADGRKRRK